MISTFCRGIGCLLKNGCLRWLRNPLPAAKDDHVIEKCDEESRDLYVTKE